MIRYSLVTYPEHDWFTAASHVEIENEAGPVVVVNARLLYAGPSRAEAYLSIIVAAGLPFKEVLT